jgi:tetratricopeptide (TPR) repeat protein
MNKMFSNIPIPSIFICFLIFCAWIHYERHRTTRKYRRASRTFWDREDEANHTKNKDISNLSLFAPDKDRIPMPITEDENISYYQERVQICLTKPMMDLSAFTNTDLKLAYGTGNFKTLSEYDENFNVFLMNLSNLGKAYRTAGMLRESAGTYEQCIASGSDKSTDYKSLAYAYAMTENHGKLQDLIASAEASDLPRKAALVEFLRSIQKDPDVFSGAEQ